MKKTYNLLKISPELRTSVGIAMIKRIDAYDKANPHYMERLSIILLGVNGEVNRNRDYISEGIIAESHMKRCQPETVLDSSFVDNPNPEELASRLKRLALYHNSNFLRHCSPSFLSYEPPKRVIKGLSVS